MIQRKQSVFLFLAVIVEILTLCLPLGILKPMNVGVDAVVYNLWIQNGNGTSSLVSMPLFVILAVAVIITAVTIFLYRNRKLQIKLCSWSMFLVIVWYAVYATISFVETSSDNTSLKLSFASVLPLVALILVFMARKGVMADEALIRAAERIR